MFFTIITVTLFTIVSGFLLLIVSVSLLGLLVRGLFESNNSELKKHASQNKHDFIKSVSKKAVFADRITTLISAALVIIFFIILNNFFGILVAASAALMMVGRLPDLLWEIKNGRKISTQDKYHKGLYYGSLLVLVAAFTVLWFAVYLKLN